MSEKTEPAPSENTDPKLVASKLTQVGEQTRQAGAQDVLKTSDESFRKDGLKTNGPSGPNGSTNPEG